MKAKTGIKTESQKAKQYSQFSDVLRVRILYFVFTCYVVLVICGAANHEAWRDEAQAWLLVRDTTLTQLFSTLPSEGHPPLWYLLVWPLVKLGLPYESQNYLCAAMMIAAVGLFLFKTRLPFMLKCLLPFSYFLLFEYAFFARSYCLIVFFIAAILSIYPRRFERPWGFALCIVGLFNTHMLIFSFSFSLLLLYVREAYNQKLRHKLWPPILTAAAGGLYLLPYLASSKMSGSFKADVPAGALVQTIQQGLLINGYSFLALALLLLALTGLLYRPLLLLVAIGGLAGVFYILDCLYPGAVRHNGIVFLILIASYGLAQYYPTTKSPWVSYNYMIVCFIMLCQLKPAFDYYAGDLNNPYSGAKAAAAFIRDNRLQQKIIVGQQAWAVSAILPYLPEVKKIYYAECERYGTYYVYDTCYNRKTWLYAPDFALNMAYKHFNDRLHNVILIVNHRLFDKNEAYLDLMYTNEDQPIRADESFYIYKFKDNVR